jgi:hypothetical protein
VPFYSRREELSTNVNTEPGVEGSPAPPGQNQNTGERAGREGLTGSLEVGRAALAEPYRRMLFEESGIDPEVAAERGYRTIRRRSDMPPGFAKKKRRLGLLIPMYSPDGTTTGCQLRPDRPYRNEGGKPYRYACPTGARVIADVHPRMMGAAADPDVPLWITEGVKKGDALTSRGRCAISLIGVWNFRLKRSPEMLPCFNYVALQGRRVFVVYDSDVMVKPEVQKALYRLVGDLEGRGARPLVVYLPDAPGGGKQGVDDYLAAGGSVEQLEKWARPFDWAGIAAVRLARDDRLWAVVGRLRAAAATLPARRRGECSARAIIRDLIATAEREGKVRPGGVAVARSMRAIARGAEIGSLRAVREGLDRLEAAGRIRRVDEPGRAEHQPATYLLLDPEGEGARKGYKMGEAQAKGEASRKGKGKGDEQNASSADYPLGVSLTRAPSDSAVPELRWPKVILSWERRDGRRVVADAHYVVRLGKKRREIIACLYDRGISGEEELWREFRASPRTRLRAFRKTWLAPLAADGIIEKAGGGWRVTANWRAALDAARERDGEIEDARRQAERYADQSRKWRRRAETIADPEPALRGREPVRRTLEANRERWRRAGTEAERQKVGVSPGVFVADELEGATGCRWAEMRERWQARGGRAEHLRTAVASGPFRFVREASDGQLYVYREGALPAAAKPTEPAPTTPLRPGPDRARPAAARRPAAPRRVDGIYVHRGDCACEWCADAPMPRYAGGAA